MSPSAAHPVLRVPRQSAAIILFLAAVLLAGAPISAAPWSDHKFPAQVPPRNEVFVENLVPVAMRDGVLLYADVYRPAGNGRHPVLVSRTCSSTELEAGAFSSYTTAMYFARRGYAYVYQDVRGRYESEGKWEPFRDETKDGYDTVQWAARQAWSNGKVAMQGGSYIGFAQWRAAAASPPALVTIFPVVASTSPYHDWVTLNGGWRLAWNVDFGAVRFASRIRQETGPNTAPGSPAALSYETVLWHLPLDAMQALLGRSTQFYRDWMAHPDYDDYWREVNTEERFEQIGIPVHTMGGWFDLFCQGTLRGFEGVSRKGASALARERSQMIVGPWGHQVSRTVGDIDFGPDAVVDQQAIELRWFDYWLRGIDDGLTAEPPVKLFVMGRNEWRFENEYPLARARYSKLYFSSGGRANSLRGDGRLSWVLPDADASPDRYSYDPQNPVRSVPWLREERSAATRNDVLVYTSEFLDKDVEVTGPVKVVLYASSDAPDTDFVAKLVDVYPDERAYGMAQGILRTRYRDGVGNPQLLEPGTVCRLEIDLVGTSVAFQKGHRIRVQIASSDFPNYNRNLNNGEPFGSSVNGRTAHQTIYHSRSQPSHVLLPVIP